MLIHDKTMYWERSEGCSEISKITWYVTDEQFQEFLERHNDIAFPLPIKTNRWMNR